MDAGKPLILDIDLGNTAAKWCLRAEGKKHYGSESAQLPLLDALSTFFADTGFVLAEVSQVSIASVCSAERNSEIEQAFAARKLIKPNWLASEQQTAGITNSYSQPQSMGVDRWAAIVAAVAHLRGNKRSLCSCIVDAGSALTLDFIDAHANHCGGYIVPGYAMQRDALFGNTANVKVRQQNKAHETLLPGSNTDQAVEHGIVLSMTSFIEAAVQQFAQQQGGRVSVLVTGGDAPMLQRLSQLPMSYHQHLVLDGIALLA